MSHADKTPAYPSSLIMVLSAFNTAMGGKPLVMTSSPLKEPHKFQIAEITQVAVAEDMVDPVRSQWRLMAEMPGGEAYWVAPQRYSYNEIIATLTQRELAAARTRGVEGSDDDILAKLQKGKLSTHNVLRFS